MLLANLSTRDRELIDDLAESGFDIEALAKRRSIAISAAVEWSVAPHIAKAIELIRSVLDSFRSMHREFKNDRIIESLSKALDAATNPAEVRRLAIALLNACRGIFPKARTIPPNLERISTYSQPDEPTDTASIVRDFLASRTAPSRSAAALPSSTLTAPAHTANGSTPRPQNAASAGSRIPDSCTQPARTDAPAATPPASSVPTVNPGVAAPALQSTQNHPRENPPRPAAVIAAAGAAPAPFS